jgi:hypothetical protein
MGTISELSPPLYFSYGQFMVYDESVDLPGCDWTDEHSKQGFARREGTVNFSTMLEFGYADVVAHCGPYEARGSDERVYERVIAVPFQVVSGTVVVEGPEETEVSRRVALPCGHYRVVAAQLVSGEEAEQIDLYFELVGNQVERSAILVRDDKLSPPRRLLETAGVAG